VTRLHSGNADLGAVHLRGYICLTRTNNKYNAPHLRASTTLMPVTLDPTIDSALKTGQSYPPIYSSRGVRSSL